MVTKLQMTALAPTTKRGFVVLGTVTGIDVAGLRTRLGSQIREPREITGQNLASPPFSDVNFPPNNRARTRARAAGFPREGRKSQRAPAGQAG